MALSNAAVAPSAGPGPPLPAAPAEPASPLARRRAEGRLRAGLRFCRRNPLVLVGAAVVLLWIVVSVAAPLVAPYGPLTQKVADRLKEPSAQHLFGTDALGRDIFSRVVY